MSFLSVVIFISLVSSTRCFNLQRLRGRLAFEIRSEFHSTSEIAQCISNLDFNVVRSAAAGSLAGGLRALSRGLTFPFDTMKTFEQAKGVETKKRTIAEDFRGCVPTVVSAIPANALFFMTYDYLVSVLPCAFSNLSPLANFQQRLILSAIATLPQNAIKIPAELIKQRAQIQSESNFTALFLQATAESGLKGLYRGGGAQLLREIPYNAIQMASFAMLQDLSTSYHSNLGPAEVAGVLGLLAAAIASILTQPADVVKTRIMTDLEDGLETEAGSSAMDGLIALEDSSEPPVWWANVTVIRYCVAIIREEGIGGLFAGMTPRLLLVSFGGMVYFWAAAITDVYFDKILK